MTNPSPDAPEPPALDFEAWWREHETNLCLHITVLDVVKLMTHLAWQAASAVQAKCIAELKRDYAQLLDRAVTANKAHSATLTRAEAAEQSLTDTQAERLKEIKARQEIILPAEITLEYVLQMHCDKADLLKERDRLIVENEALAIADQKILRQAQERWERDEAALKLVQATAQAQLAEAVAALTLTQWGFNHVRCPVCAGYNTTIKGSEVDHQHTKDCPVGLVLAHHAARAKPASSLNPHASE